MKRNINELEIQKLIFVNTRIKHLLFCGGLHYDIEHPLLQSNLKTQKIEQKNNDCIGNK